MKTLAVLHYPPEYDGQLHINIAGIRPDSNMLEISLNFARKKNETVRQALRRLGRELADQPLHIHKEGELE